MVLLHIALQDGFVNDTVVICVNGEEIYRNRAVKTRFQIGLADSFERSVQEGSVSVEVTLPLKNLSESVQFQATGTVYFGVSITAQGEIDCKISHEPFGYV